MPGKGFFILLLLGVITKYKKNNEFASGIIRLPKAYTALTLNRKNMGKQ